MATYELDDELVRKFISKQDSAGWRDEVADEVAATLEKQLPLPVPAKIGAVVRTDHNTCYIRWAYDAHTHEPWIEHSSDAFETYRTDAIGRITEVLSEGVDL